MNIDHGVMNIGQCFSERVWTFWDSFKNVLFDEDTICLLH